ncbi:MAG: pyridoxal-phosphate dependent enzyme [Flavobacteriaceae bacterium]|nr:pyridoxal-phosphate dependent enzyme [Flavobacteriaceae bacterium]
MERDAIKIPIVEIPNQWDVRLFVKREDWVHREISGNKYWKMFYNVKNYLSKEVENRLIITFGGAFSNHIAATSAVGEKFGVKTLGVIRGEELENQWQENPTLAEAHRRGMEFLFVNREEYRNKELITQKLKEKHPEALIVPEGGTNELAVEGVKYMLDERTQDFDYLCTAVGTGGTISGLSKFAENHQKVLGFKVVKDDSVGERINQLSGKQNFQLFEAHEGRYGKITDETVAFINGFYQKHKVPLDPIYTGKMMKHLFEFIEKDYFPKNAKILAFHTGGLQGVLGANELLKKQNRNLLKIEI